MILSIGSIDRKVENLKAKGLDLYWDGWTLHKFTPHAAAFMSKKGIYRNGKYGFVESYSVNDAGEYNLTGIFGRKSARR